MTMCGDLSVLSLLSQACSKNSLLIIVNMIFWSKYVICSATSSADNVEMLSLLGTWNWKFNFYPLWWAVGRCRISFLLSLQWIKYYNKTNALIYIRSSLRSSPFTMRLWDNCVPLVLHVHFDDENGYLIGFLNRKYLLKVLINLSNAEYFIEAKVYRAWWKLLNGFSM